MPQTFSSFVADQAAPPRAQSFGDFLASQPEQPIATPPTTQLSGGSQPAAPGPAGYSPLFVNPNTPKPRGMVQPGNIDLKQLPVINNGDGSYSTVYGTSFSDEKPGSPTYGKEVLVRGILNGKKTDDADALRREYYKSGKHLGVFDSGDNATPYAMQLHSDWEQGKISGVQMGTPAAARPPGLPSPDVVDRQTTQHANTLASIILQTGAPPAPPPPIAGGLTGPPAAQPGPTISAQPDTLMNRLAAPFTGPGSMYGNVDSQRTGGRTPYNPEAPLIDFGANAKHDTEGPIAKAFTTHVQDALSSFTTLKSIGLLLATAGLGAAGKLAGTAEASSPKLVAAGARYFPKIKALVSAGFSGDMIYSAAKKSPQLVEQIKRGDVPGAVGTLTDMGISAGMGVLAGKHALSEFKGTPKAAAPKATANSTGTEDYKPAPSKPVQPPAQPPAALHGGSDDTYQQAVGLVRTAGKGSTSLLQRTLRLGYGDASRMLDRMEAEGIVGPADGSKPRKLLQGSAAGAGWSVVSSTPEPAKPAAQKAPAPGMVRLYRGVKPGTFAPVTDEAMQDGPGHQFTTDPDLAKFYGPVHFVDVPESVANDPENHQPEKWHSVSGRLLPAKYANAIKLLETREPEASTIERPGVSDGKQSAAVDARAARPVDTGGTGEEGAVHGAPPSGSRSLIGKATRVLIPGDRRSIPARYEIRELDDSQASHNGQTFAPNPKYGLKNERDYSQAENQQRVVENSSEENFEPAFHINNNPDMANGPTFLDEDSNAIAGNQRHMQLERVYARNGAKAREYRQMLHDEAHVYGIDPAGMSGMKRPGLFRVAESGALDDLPGGSKWAIRKTNVTGTAALSSSERAVADAGQMTPEMIGHIAGAIEDAGPDATLNDALTGRSGTVIVNRLIAEGFFSEQERPALMDGKTGALTQSAKDRISKALLGQFFRDSDQIARTPASIRNKLERVAAPLAKVAGNSEWDITPEVREAIDLTEYASAHGIRNLGDIVSQTGMFGEAPRWSDGAVKLAEFLRDGKPNDVVSAFRKYVNSKEPTMFGESTPAEAFRDAFGAEKPPAQPAQPTAAPVTEPSGTAAEVPESASAEPAPREPAGPTYMGSGFGALEPLFRESKAEGDRLRLARDEALKAANAAEAKPEEMKAGEKVRAYLTSERDLWAARTNQAIDVITRKVLPKMKDREALGIAREFRHHPLELQSFIDGSHPFLSEVDGGTAVAEKNLAKLMPVLRQAQRILAKPTAAERAADAAFTNIAERDLQEGRAGGWLESRWRSDEYLPHALNPKGEGQVAKMPSTTGKAMGKIGKWFGFGERRSDRYPTLVHAVADGIIPKTLDPSALFTIHADGFARARATHLLEKHLAETGLGKWGDAGGMPVGWVQLASHTDEFRKRFVETVPNSYDPEAGESEHQVATMGLFVPEFIERALAPITDPDYTAKMPGFAKLRTAQRGLKEAILGFSGFHLLTENFMAAADIGPTGMYRAFREPILDVASQANERDLIASGGTTSIQGSVMSAYRTLRPGTIPTRAEVVRAYIPGSKQALEVADAVTRFTFDNVQRRFKIWSFALHRDAWIKDNPAATPGQLAEAKKGIASYVNGVYGGLHWENMGIPRAMTEVARFFFLAPDWSGSNLALGKYALDAPLSAKEMPFLRRLAGAATKESAQARLSRAFWTKQLLGGLVATQMLSLLLSGKLSRRPFQVSLGKDRSGEDVFQNVMFRGSAGDLISLGTKMEDHGLLVGTGVFVGSKLAPFTKTGEHLITGRDDLGREITPKGMSVAVQTVRSAGSVIGDISPVPIIARGAAKTMLGDQSDKYLWSERMLDLFGSAAQHVPPAGTHMSDGILRPNAEREENSAFDQLKTGRVYKARGAR